MPRLHRFIVGRASLRRSGLLGLEARAEPSLWNEIFLPSRSTIEELDRFAKQFDFGVLVLTPDDERQMRGEVGRIPRDNVIFELGLFIGALGRDRVFYLVPRDYSVKLLPTDLLGVTALEYKPRTDGNVEASVRTACTRILDRIEAVNDGQRSPLLGFWDSVDARHKMNRDPRSLMASAEKRIFVSGITLNYIIQHCKNEIINALGRGVLVEFVIAANTDKSKSIYERYSSLVERPTPCTQEVSALSSETVT